MRLTLPWAARAWLNRSQPESSISAGRGAIDFRAGELFPDAAVEVEIRAVSATNGIVTA